MSCTNGLVHGRHPVWIGPCEITECLPISRHPMRRDSLLRVLYSRMSHAKFRKTASVLGGIVTGDLAPLWSAHSERKRRHDGQSLSLALLSHTVIATAHAKGRQHKLSNINMATAKRTRTLKQIILPHAAKTFTVSAYHLSTIRLELCVPSH
jgi:hypothetical protein